MLCLTQVQLLKACVQGELVYIKDNLRDTDEAAFEFAVGDHIFASRRKVPPLNEEGAVAIVTNRRIVQRNNVYEITYLLTKNV
jgi:UDP-N-acetylmuramyl tripeptide synthase